MAMGVDGRGGGGGVAPATNRSGSSSRLAAANVAVTKSIARAGESPWTSHFCVGFLFQYHDKCLPKPRTTNDANLNYFLSLF